MAQPLIPDPKSLSMWLKQPGQVKDATGKLHNASPIENVRFRFRRGRVTFFTKDGEDPQYQVSLSQLKTVDDFMHCINQTVAHLDLTFTGYTPPHPLLRTKQFRHLQRAVRLFPTIADRPFFWLTLMIVTPLMMLALLTLL